MNPPHWSSSAALRSREPVALPPAAEAAGGADGLPRRPRALLFDMGDVLFDATAWRRWLRQLLARLGCAREYGELFGLWDRDYLVHVHRGRWAYEETLRKFLADLGLSSGVQDEVLHASRLRKQQLEARAQLYPGVRQTLARLRRSGVRLAVVTDSESKSAEIALRLHRLGAGQFDSLVSSVELGRTKPDPACYKLALQQLGVAPAEAAFVGHDAEELDGAAAVGLLTIAIHYEPAARADVYLQRFDGLLNLVAQPDCVAAGAGT